MTKSENDIWTIKAALDWTVGYLERKGDANPRLSAEWLLGEACGLRRIELYTSFERPLSLEEREVLRGYVARRGSGEPLQYITGEVAFRHIAIKVRPGVLIPRPETEVLVSEALGLLPDAARPRATDSQLTEAEAEALIAEQVSQASQTDVSREALGEAARGGEQTVLSGERVGHGFGSTAESLPQTDVSRETPEPATPAANSEPDTLLVADICTGSGCIACSLAYEHEQVRVVATDIAPEATSLARENAAALNLDDRVRVLQCDLGEGIPDRFMGRFDLVVSNPPYVPTAVLADVPREVADFEPALALDGGADGLDVLRRLLVWCMHALKPGGGIAFELFEGHMEQAADLARAAGFLDVRIVCDLAGKPRVLVGRSPQHPESPCA